MENEKIDYEIWLSAYKREDIEVSNQCRVRMSSTEKLLKTYAPTVNDADYSKGMQISYWKGRIPISELMAETFLNNLYFKQEKKIIKFLS